MNSFRGSLLSVSNWVCLPQHSFTPPFHLFYSSTRGAVSLSQQYMLHYKQQMDDDTWMMLPTALVTHVQVCTQMQCRQTWIRLTRGRYTDTHTRVYVPSQTFHVRTYIFQRWQASHYQYILWLQMICIQQSRLTSIPNTSSKEPGNCNCNYNMRLTFPGLNFCGWLLIRKNYESLTPQKLKCIQCLTTKYVHTYTLQKTSHTYIS